MGKVVNVSIGEEIRCFVMSGSVPHDPAQLKKLVADQLGAPALDANSLPTGATFEDIMDARLKAFGATNVEIFNR